MNSALSLPLRFAQRLHHHLAQPGPSLALHVFRVVLAAFLALMASLLLDLGSPRTAVFAVFLVMQPRTGLVFQKSFYRLLGTVAGVAVSVLLIGYTVQTPQVFVLLFALWVAFCTAGSFIFRNFQSYGFVLAGYTVCFVALPLVDNPEAVFDLGANRLLEMFIGVGCAALISDTVFPQRMADLVTGALQRRFTRLLEVLTKLGAPLPAESTRYSNMLGFVGDALGLEALRANTALESSDLRRRRQHLAMLNHLFMSLSTTLHSVLALRRRREQTRPGGPVGQALQALQGELSERLAAAPAVRHAGEALPRLQAWRSVLPERIAHARAALPATLDAPARLDYETGAELLERLAEELQVYCQHHIALEAGEPSVDAVAEQSVMRFSTRSDPMLVGLAALRGFLITIVGAYLWWLSGWSWGAGALTNAVAPGTLFAGLPSPTRVLRDFSLGCCLALPAGLVWNFVLAPMATDWIGLVAMLLPVLAFCAWFSARPQSAGIGAGFYIVFILHSSLERSFALQPQDYIEGHVADLVGVGIAAIFYLILDPNRGAWRQTRIVRALQAQIVNACTAVTPPRREHLESASRDLVQSIATRGELAHDADRWVFDWMLRVLEIGRSVLDLRASMAEAPPDALPLSLPIALQRIGTLFAQPDDARRQDALNAVEQALAALHPSEPVQDDSDPGRPPLPARLTASLRQELHFIRTALLDASTRPRAHFKHA